MANYFTKFLPQLGNSATSSPYYDSSTSYNPQLKYLTIFNPSLIEDKKAESNEELFKQIICFISINSIDNGGVLSEEEKIEQLKIIGLIRGVNSFAISFSKGDDKSVNIINSSKSSIVLINLESNFYLACSISYMAKHNNKSNFINHQLIKLIRSFYRNFVIHHTTFGNILDKYNLSILKQSLSTYWNGFFSNYNLQYYKIPPGLSWPNSLNYKGFLGLLPADQIYKKSSLSLNYQVQQEISQILQGPDENIPKGIIISCFNKIQPKKYGLLHIEHNPKLKESELIDIYNWLEFHDYHDTLTTESLSNISIDDFFKTNLSILPDIESETSSTLNASSINTNASPSYAHQYATDNIRAVTSTAMEMLNPRNITNNLVISPINYTVSSMISIGDQVKQYGTGIAENDDVTSASSWLQMPPLLKSLRLGGTVEPVISPSMNGDNDDEEEIEEENTGEYLIGSKFDLVSNSNSVYRKLVYLTTTSDTDDTGTEFEYSLIIYKKDDIVITLIYDSSYDQLDKLEFYETLAQDTLIPSIDEIGNSVLGGSFIGSSVGSLNGIINENDVDNDFFFVVFDKAQGWVKSSLPYLPHININDDENNHKALIMYQSAMFYLHDQLTSLFLMQRNNNFFTDNKMNEYFHKFTSNKQNDWMLYYIKYKDKFIIIIKNHNHSAKKKRKSIAYRKLSVVPPSVSTSPILNGEEQQQLEGGNTGEGGVAGGGLLNRITDYTHLGFLDNLGDDVKYWLDGFTTTSET
ncbi:hypothetical protein DFJ63DRAFT_312524 [Scheffersomyces coipomensis]|uniref:uncharacterized protein n=1 Tax=Scheffersomyces coipomensis TaxID=1788519 RepID=UPI00315C6011